MLLSFPLGSFQITQWTLLYYNLSSYFLISNYSIMSHQLEGVANVTALGV